MYSLLPLNANTIAIQERDTENAGDSQSGR